MYRLLPYLAGSTSLDVVFVSVTTATRHSFPRAAVDNTFGHQTLCLPGALLISRRPSSTRPLTNFRTAFLSFRLVVRACPPGRLDLRNLRRIRTGCVPVRGEADIERGQAGDGGAHEGDPYQRRGHHRVASPRAACEYLVCPPYVYILRSHDKHLVDLMALLLDGKCF